MKKLSNKKCAFCNVEFQGYTAQKYCDEHRNKICRICKKIKEEKIWDWRSLCRKCEAERTLNYYKRKISENPDFNKELYKRFRQQKLNQRKKYIQNNPQKRKEYYEKNKEKIKIKSKKYVRENREKYREYTRKWMEKDIEYYKKIKKKNMDDWRKKNPHIIAWRNSIHRLLKQFSKKKIGKTSELLGYSAIELKIHIENLFTEGMSWDNYGTWHIDHIKPVISFSKDSHPSVVNALSNLRPLWKSENLKRPKK
jgi:hypothetical protein